jgi:hypothetical protein
VLVAQLCSQLTYSEQEMEYRVRRTNLEVLQLVPDPMLARPGLNWDVQLMIYHVALLGRHRAGGSAGGRSMPYT